ncbi:MAG: 2-oxo acid dehydrogenase subunit E2 [Gammaproteobacteria bacterium]
MAFPRHRRHTYLFLERARDNAAVLLDAELDMSNVRLSRAAYKEQGIDISYISFLIKAISEVLTRYPRANSSVLSSWYPRMVLYDRVAAKFTLDKTGYGERMVLSGLVDASDKKTIEEIQRDIDRYKAADYENSEAFAAVRKLNGLPLLLARRLYGWLLDKASKRQAIQGSFTVTSLGHRRVEGFVPISSTTLAFGVGTIKDTVAVADGAVVVRPMMRLSMVFDHRAIDGAMAADILDDIIEAVER